jgi:transcriptional regulator with XRE-family HTH domain
VESHKSAESTYLSARNVADGENFFSITASDAIWISTRFSTLFRLVIDISTLKLNYLYVMSEKGGSSSRASRQAVQRRLGLEIRKLRERRGWIRERFAERLGVPLYSLAKWEAGAHAPPLNDLVRLLEVLEVTFEELVLGHSAPAPVLPPEQRDELRTRFNALGRAMQSLLQSAERKKTEK